MKRDLNLKFPLSLLSEKARQKEDLRISRLCKALQPLKGLLRMCSTLYGHISFVEWLDLVPKQKKASAYQHFKSRRQLWNFLLNVVKSEGIQYVFEFGVANGDGARFWLANLTEIKYHGYDCFLGMPENYRQVPKGVFSLNGIPPEIADPRVTWHVGYVEDTLTLLDIPDDQPCLFLFDLDLYSATNFCVQIIAKRLKRSDILYFDEAWDDAEGVVAREFLSKSKDLRLLASATGCMALQVADQ
jgi:hypothetical protein